MQKGKAFEIQFLHNSKKIAQNNFKKIKKNFENYAKTLDFKILTCQYNDINWRKMLNCAMIKGENL